MVTSIAIALTTVPMPKDVIFPFVGSSIGNESTCAAQGFLIVIGAMFTIGANCSLNMYYASIYWLGMRQDDIKKKLLPTMLIFWVCICIPAATTPLALGLFNPRPWEPYCYFGSYPPNCNVNDAPFTDIECIGREVSPVTENKVMLLYLGLMGLCFLLILISLILVVVSVFKMEHTMKEIILAHPAATAADHTRAKEFRQTRTVLRVALMYIFAFFLSWIWYVIAILFGSIIEYRLIWQIIDHGKLICGPLQGFFNAFIFIYNKMHTLRESNEERHRNLKFWQALKRIIISPSIVPELVLSRVEMVVEDNEGRMDRQAQVDNDEEELESMSSDNNNSSMERVSEVSPASLPSNFVSIDTPSFASSNVSSTGVIQREGNADDNECQDEDQERQDQDQGQDQPAASPNVTSSRLYYSATPPSLLTWKSDPSSSFKN